MDKADDTYFMLEAPSEGEYREKGSKFLAFAFPVRSEDQVKEALEQVRKWHPKARHHCYAYRLGYDGTRYRANDDGEPSGTAGRPILGQIDSKGLTNTVVIVVRYFGGTLLGTSGLIRSYKSSAADALEKGNIVEQRLMDVFRVAFPYDKVGEVMRVAKQTHAQVLAQHFHLSAQIELGIRKSRTEDLLTALKAGIGGISREEAAQTETIEGLEITYLETK